MAPVEMEIVKALKDSGGELSMNDLVSKVQENLGTSVADVRAAVLPMISGECIEMTPDRKLRLHE
jgi:DNA-directed RNA polymerase delta subunit